MGNDLGRRVRRMLVTSEAIARSRSGTIDVTCDNCPVKQPVYAPHTTPRNWRWMNGVGLCCENCTSKITRERNERGQAFMERAIR